ncbi:hypothetical protein Agabi119p4_3912 [Agaricus bisporus var. burnettii]|uniref:F-box domain-containing protein n=1 Tax=Agaricus bisporus var. burnettii TaxID=192524 RepID=A0A8H7F5U4_AGABI|nr:hypothetical protein Agabi119p4_3912 [Agaricus bisporus var. burnettii]
MPNFYELPDDILLEIFEFLLPQKDNLCNLRLCSRHLSRPASRLLFRRLVIELNNGTRQGAFKLDKSSIISALASGATTVFEHTKELIVFHDFFGPLPTFSLKPISNLTVFQGFWFPKAPYLVLEIASLLTRCPNLTQLLLTNGSFEEVTLNDFFLEAGKMEKALKLQDLRLNSLVVSPEGFETYVCHFRNLKSIAITGNRSTSAPIDLGVICRILQQNDVYLEHLSTDHPEDFLVLTYLSSYSGLKTLEFGPLCMVENLGSFEAVNWFYTQVLPNQAEALEGLRLHFRNPGVWCEMPTVNQLAGLAKCRKLKTLSVSSTYTPENVGSARTNWASAFPPPFKLPIYSLLSDSRSFGSESDCSSRT